MGRDSRQQAFNQDTAAQTAAAGKATAAADSIAPDLTAGQTAGITNATMGGIDTASKNAQDEMLRRESATGSSAGVPETLLESSREAGQQKAQAGAGLQEYFANVPIQRALAKAGIYLPVAGQAAEMSGTVAPPPAKSMFSQIMGGLGAAASVAAAPFTGGASLVGLPGSLNQAGGG